MVIRKEQEKIRNHMTEGLTPPGFSFVATTLSDQSFLNKHGAQNLGKKH